MESVGNGEGVSEESEDVQETLKKLQSEIGEIKSRVMITSGSDHSQFDEVHTIIKSVIFILYDKFF